VAGTVAVWRCICGTSIKVIAEMDSNPPATQTVSCPKCHAPQAVHADTIITISKDMSDLGPFPRCEEKERLLGAQNIAFDIYRRGVTEIAEPAGTVAHSEFEFIAKRVRAARQAFLAIRQQLIEHNAKHSC
jgi:hypothetical protein